jgi:beta-mannosidase
MNRPSFLLRSAGLFFSLLLTSQILMGQDVLREPLSTGWTVKSTDFSTAEELSTPVPGTVQEVLSRSGLLPDPYYGTNETEVQWVGERNWEYNLFFTPEPLDSTRAYRLHFAGLDTYAKVYLNDSLILTADNMFRSWQVPVTTLLKAGTNHLRVAFTAPIEALAETIKNLPYALNKTSVNDTGDPRMANFARKAQFQFGWDWGLRLVTQGIWRPVYLESWEHTRLEEIQYFQEVVTTALARIRVYARIDRRSPGAYELRLRDLGTGRLLAKRALTKTEEEVNFNFQIDQPRLWWPNGHGEAHRYHLSCELWLDGVLQDQQEKKIGIRTVELVQRPDAYGTSFYFKINGRPIFTKGASYIPQDAILTRVTAQQKTDLLVQTHHAHFNLIRVWGGGIYEDEHFYDQCDSLGLMVWQDFMFACAAYPASPAFLANVEAEVRENVRRLRNHPSIIIWCGNNEVDLAMRNWGWQRQYDIKGENEQDMYRNYTKIFQELIPTVLAEEDSERPYSHTTPLSSYHNSSQR